MGIQSSIADLTNLKRLAEAVNQTYADLCEHGGDQLAEAWNSAELAYDDAANPDVVLALLAEVESLRKDAARYQWLRDKSESVHSFYLSVPIWFSSVRFRKEDVDSSIDTAIGNGEQS
jgi:hypothetical protein